MDSLAPALDADLDHPLEMLHSCHERILRQCQLIERIADQVRWRRVDKKVHDVACFVLRYFDSAAAQHHDDEEEDLFPIIEHYVPSARLNEARAVIHRLRADHQKLDELWAAVRQRLQALIEGGESGLTPELAREFSEAYAAHIECEELELLPLARHVLDARLRAVLRASMAKRRGLSAAVA